MITRDEKAHRTFWYFINERHKIWQKRNDGLPKPWTDDEILQNWRFCNVFRRLDKQSQYLINKVYSAGLPAELLVFNTFAFRAFNLDKTWDVIAPKGYLVDWEPEKVQDQLYKIVYEDNKPFTSGAYMLRGREGMPKYVSIIMTLTTLWWEQKLNLAKIAIETRSLEVTVEEILAAQLWGWGPFTAYQVALDLTYTHILEHAVDLNTWCEFGPGAKRGIKLIWPDAPASYYLTAAKDLFESQYLWRESHVPHMTLQDIEFSLCELQKYMRIESGGRSKEKFNGQG